jgi:hypothetical protein
MISTIEIELITTGNFITPKGDTIKYIPSIMSGNKDMKDTIYFSDDVKFTMKAIKEAGFGTDIKSIFTNSRLFKKIHDFIEKKYGRLTVENANTFLKNDKYNKETSDILAQQEIQKIKTARSETSNIYDIKTTYKIPEEEIYKLKKTHIINSNINFILEYFFPHKGKFIIEGHTAIIHYVKYNNTYVIKKLKEMELQKKENYNPYSFTNIISSNNKYSIQIYLSLLNPKDANVDYEPSKMDFTKLNCIDKSGIIEDQFNKLFNVSFNFFPRPANQIILNKYKQTDEYKEKMFEEQKEKNKKEKEKQKEKEKKYREKKEREEIENYTKLKREYDLAELKKKMNLNNKPMGTKINGGKLLLKPTIINYKKSGTKKYGSNKSGTKKSGTNKTGTNKTGTKKTRKRRN